MDRNQKSAVCWILSDSFILSLMLLLGGILGKSVSPFQVVFLVNAMAAIAAIALFSKGQWENIRPTNMSLHVFRGALGVSSTVCLFYALQYLSLAEVTAINFFVPLITSVLSVYIFKEKPKHYVYGAIVLNLAGVLLMLSPKLLNEVGNSESPLTGLAFSLCAVTALVIYNVNLKRIGNAEKVIPQMVFGPLYSALLLLPVMYFVWTPLDTGSWLLIMVYGALLITKLAARFFAFNKSDLSKLMPLEYAQILFSSILGYFFLNQTQSVLGLVGIALIVLSSVSHLLFMHFENKQINDSSLGGSQ
ncbi:DMT family transporter [Pseudoalteromonas sp. DL2-H2.2]|uniref:DMT family transporter n=1 Tax=Pseudoalteromonas sp. DL2-H2.2 TaxID=2908889 RepID=UPI001F36831A|nr:DMT family transporter [Pseudoalteromonas sp. DL2-H2.2]MCF2906730.1 DMT family transporter [Pseudoalteromonas sp. DL2-H2.2]